MSSGNAGTGRTRKTRKADSSEARRHVFSVVLEQRLTTTRDGKTVELSFEDLSLEEAYKRALAGSVRDIKLVVKAIEKREKWFLKRDIKRGIRPDSVQIVMEPDPDNADEAMRLLKTMSRMVESYQQALKDAEPAPPPPPPKPPPVAP